MCGVIAHSGGDKINLVTKCHHGSPGDNVIKYNIIGNRGYVNHTITPTNACS